jgi:hypothetical protein
LAALREADGSEQSLGRGRGVDGRPPLLHFLFMVDCHDPAGGAAAAFIPSARAPVRRAPAALMRAAQSGVFVVAFLLAAAADGEGEP